jgi:DNA-directed RNA polymerase subunit RPC12/RpoP
VYNNQNNSEVSFHVPNANRQVNCPQCGDLLPLHFSYSKLAQCPSCGVHIFLEDEGARLAGEQSVLSLEPSLISLHQAFEYNKQTFTPIGHIRFGVGRNIWDEWWCVDRGKGYWLSVDEGDYILESEIEFSLPLYSYKEITLNQEIKGWRVTELDEGVCLGYEGELPEIIEVGEKHHYAHLSKSHGEMMTVEFFGKTKKLYSGKWLDPYAIRKALSS